MRRVGTEFLLDSLLIFNDTPFHLGCCTFGDLFTFGLTNEVRCTNVVVIQFLNPTETAYS